MPSLPGTLPSAHKTNSGESRYAGLDGLRAIAVILVLVYHLFPAAGVRGGFLGVDLFFVLSGFLITSLLLREHDRNGRIGIRAFWVRRARRLIPALVVVILTCATAAWIIGGDLLVGVGAQIFGAATFTSNWIAVAAGGDYFAATQPDLFRNFWSLGVEEQFYALWPAVFLLVVALPARALRVTFVVALAAVSLVAALSVAGTTGEISRVYYGTDTHAFGLLLGAALAAFARGTIDRLPLSLTHPIPLEGGWRIISDPRVRVPAVLTAPARRWMTAAGVAALVALLVLAMAEPPADATGTVWLLLAASCLGVVAIAASIWPSSPLGVALDLAPLRWVGERSYGLYLWHWPLLVLLQGSALAAIDATLLGLICAVLTVAAASVSYRWVETPIRARGFGGAFRHYGSALKAKRVLPVLASVAGIALVATTTAAVVAAPAKTSAQVAIERGASMMGGSYASSPPSSSPAASPSPSPSAPGQEPADGEHPAAPVLDTSPVRGTDVTAVGDSVMLASAGELQQDLPGITVDAAVSRSMWAAPGIVRDLKKRGALTPYIVLGLGTNGAIDDDLLDQVRRTIGNDRTLVLVTAFAPRDWIDGVNRDLRGFAERYRNVVVAPWDEAIAPHIDSLASDRIHPGGRGAQIFADTVRTALDEAKHRADVAVYEQQLRIYRRALADVEATEVGARVFRDRAQ